MYRNNLFPGRDALFCSSYKAKPRRLFLIWTFAFLFLSQMAPLFSQTAAGKMPPFQFLPIPVSPASVAEAFNPSTPSLPSPATAPAQIAPSQPPVPSPQGVAEHTGGIAAKSWWESLVIILYTDAIMSVENVLIIAILVSAIPQRIRLVATFSGLVAAGVFRVIFACMATILMKFDVVGILGSIALMFLTLSMFTDTVKQMRKKHEHPPEERMDFGIVREELHRMFTEKGFWNTFDGKALKTVTLTVILQDILLSLDNVLVVAGNSHGDLSLTIIGVGLSILMMATIANFMVKIVQKYPVVGFIGGLALAKAAYNLFHESYEPEAAIVAFGSIVVFIMFSHIYNRLISGEESIKPLSVAYDDTSITSTDTPLPETQEALHAEQPSGVPLAVTTGVHTEVPGMNSELLNEMVQLLRQNAQTLTRLEEVLKTKSPTA